MTIFPFKTKSGQSKLYIAFFIFQSHTLWCYFFSVKNKGKKFFKMLLIADREKVMQLREWAQAFSKA